MAKGAFRRLLYASDFHGSTRTWRKLLNAVSVYQAEAVMVGGDLTGKSVIPFVRHNSSWSARFLGQDHELATFEEKQALVQRVTDTGFYPYETNDEEMAALSGNKEEADRIFDRLMTERLESWATMAADRLKESIPIIIIPGNDDLPTIDRILDSSPGFVMAHERVVDLFDGFQVLGIGYSNMTPWRAPRDVPEEVIAQTFKTCAASVADMRRTIFLIHCPPNGTALDECMEIDESLRPVAGGTSMVHVGSTAVREAIVEYQPLIGLHGHIHESRGAARLGSSVCINAGSEYSEGILRGAIVQLRKDGRVNHLFVTA